MNMNFQQQLKCIQQMIESKGTYVPPVRKMGSKTVHDLYFFHQGVEVYVCVNYTDQRITYRNKETGEEVRM